MDMHRKNHGTIYPYSHFISTKKIDRIQDNQLGDNKRLDKPTCRTITPGMGQPGNPQNRIQSTIFVNGYFFQPGKQTHTKILQNSLQQADTRSKIIQQTSPDMKRQQRLDPVTVANMWQHLNSTADPFASLPKQYDHTVTNAFATNIIVGDQTSPGMESIFALQFPH